MLMVDFELLTTVGCCCGAGSRFVLLNCYRGFFEQFIGLNYSS